MVSADVLSRLPLPEMRESVLVPKEAVFLIDAEPTCTGIINNFKPFQGTQITTARMEAL